jgi:hypothetical protein
MQDTEKCASENNKYMKAIIRKPDTKKHKATAKQVKLKAKIHYTESLQSICYIGITTIFSSSHNSTRTGADPSFVGLEAYKILEAPVIKRIKNYEHKIRYKSEYFFI